MAKLVMDVLNEKYLMSLIKDNHIIDNSIGHLVKNDIEKSKLSFMLNELSPQKVFKNVLELIALSRFNEINKSVNQSENEIINEINNINRKYISKVLFEALDLKEDKIKSLLSLLSINITNALRDGLLDNNDELLDNIANKKLLLEDLIVDTYHYEFMDKVWNSRLNKNTEDSNLTLVSDRFKVIHKLTKKYLEKIEKPNEKIKSIKKLYLLANNMEKYLGKNISNAEYFIYQKNMKCSLIKIFNEYLSEEEQMDIKSNKNDFHYYFDEKSKCFKIRQNIFHQQVYNCVSINMFDQSFWRETSSNSFGMGTSYFDDNKYVRYKINEENREIEIMFSKNIEKSKHTTYIENIIKKLRQNITEVMGEIPNVAYVRMKGIFDVTVQTKLSEAFINAIHNGIRDVTLIEETSEKSNIKKNRLKI